METPQWMEAAITAVSGTALLVFGKIKMVSKHELERHEDVCGNRVNAQFDKIHQQQTKTFDKIIDVENTLAAYMAKVDQYILMSEKRDIRHALAHSPKGHFGGIESD